MIYLKLSEENFEYDVRGLLTSFYPGEEIVLRSDRIQGEKGPDKTLAVEYLDGRICVTFRKADSEKQADAPVDYSDRKDTKSVLKRLVYRTAV